MRSVSSLCRAARTGLLLASLAAGLPVLAQAEDYIGLVHPAHELTLSMGLGGVVASIPVTPGQQVRANQVLLVLDDRMQAIEVDRRKVVFEDLSELQATEDRVRVLKESYENTKAVFDKTGSISRDEMSRLEVEYSTARARLEQLKAQKRREKLEYEGAVRERQMRQMTAPVSGVITRIEPKVGEWAKPGETLMNLVDSSNCYLKANVPLKSVQALKAGMTLPIRFETAANTPPVNGKITFLSTVADPASGLVELRVAFANPGLRVRPGIKGVISLPDGDVKMAPEKGDKMQPDAGPKSRGRATL